MSLYPIMFLSRIPWCVRSHVDITGTWISRTDGILLYFSTTLGCRVVRLPDCVEKLMRKARGRQVGILGFWDRRLLSRPRMS